jgi:hypothetical protein
MLGGGSGSGGRGTLSFHVFSASNAFVAVADRRHNLRAPPESSRYSHLYMANFSG